MEDNENIKVRKTTTEVKGIEITFDEYYKINPKTGEEIFDRELEIENDARLYDIYKKKKGLLTVSEIKNIRDKYEMNQKEYALAIGVGEVTVNRFENGAIQTEATDAIMRLSEDPDNMYSLLTKNQTSISEDRYTLFMNKVDELKLLKNHKIAEYNKEDVEKMRFATADVDDVVSNLIAKYNKKYDLLNEEYEVETNCEYITPLKLQKLLYYIQGLSLCIYGKPAFNNKIVAWSYGPVVEDVYYKYKDKGKRPLATPKDVKRISDGLSNIIDIVIEGYGKYSAISLMELTHKEIPWKNTEKTMEITQDVIKSYFDRVYAK